MPTGPPPQRFVISRLLPLAVLTSAFVLLCPLGAVAVPSPLGVADLRADLRRLLADPTLAHTRSGVVVRSRTEGDVLYEHAPRTALLPASTTKLLTSAAAMDVLGADYRFTTSVSAGTVTADGVVPGDLYLTGTGDPTLRASAYAELAEDVAASGVSKVAGAVVADDTWFDGQRLGHRWQAEDQQYYYAAQISALTVAANPDYDTGVVGVSVTPGGAKGEPLGVRLWPRTDYVTVRADTAVTGGPGTQSTLDIARRLGGNTVTVSGQLPTGGAPVERLRTVHEPAGYAADVFAAALQRAGVEVGGDPVRGTAPPGTVELARRASMPLGELLVPMMKLSNNGHAEILTKAIGREVSGVGSWTTGLPEIATALRRIGASTDGLRLRDGSGLTRANRVSAASVADLLLAVRNEPWFATWRRALPVAGAADRMVGGTLRSRMRATPAQGNVVAKTGTLTGVSALSGYVEAANGEELVFAIINNGYTGAAPRPVQDAIAVRLARFTREHTTGAIAQPLRAEPATTAVRGWECSWAKTC
ncbi:D-alanyl-D-alanine carboxypeptidase/D-alanyl-D-alanine endopeptidase [Salinactinospora qingdaonensis]|uniref:D-alanyl-D-alanine carboxypeptidase/D-alanyl-D-alanine-endopeptidase n=1 Tax=Salinactinospora qingdaonensis TaxID=702744 RepID=A0ABP7GIT8_9ACTN